MSTRQQVIGDLSKYEHDLYKLPSYPEDYDGLDQPQPELVGGVNEADVIASSIKDNPFMHTIMLDLDVPAKLVPSSTSGHSHLYIDVPLNTPNYAALLQALRQAGVIQRGFAHQLQCRGFTSLRLPWVKKRNPAGESEQGVLF